MIWVDRRGGNRRNKFGNIKTESDGYSFASKLECSVYGILKLRVLAGEIRTIQTQDHTYLTDARVCYIPDFKCTKPNGEEFWVEAKGLAAEPWLTKIKLWRVYGPGPIEVWSGKSTNPYLKELIIPKPARVVT